MKTVRYPALVDLSTAIQDRSGGTAVTVALAEIGTVNNQTELLERMLAELKTLNLHLQSITDEEFNADEFKYDEG